MFSQRRVTQPVESRKYVRLSALRWSRDDGGAGRKTCGLDEMGLRSTCIEQFPGPWSRIKRGISLDYSLWWPLGVLSSRYLKHSLRSTLRPLAQRKLQGFGPFESFKVQALEHLSLTDCSGTAGRPLPFPPPPSPSCLVTVMEAKMVFSTGGISCCIFFSWWLTLILLYTHFLAWTVRWFNIQTSRQPLSFIQHLPLD